MLLGIRMSWLFTQVLAPTTAAMMIIFTIEQIHSEILFQTPLKALEKYCLSHHLCSYQLGTYDVGIAFVLVSELMQTKITIGRGHPGAWTSAQVHIFSPDPTHPARELLKNESQSFGTRPFPRSVLWVHTLKGSPLPYWITLHAFVGDRFTTYIGLSLDSSLPSYRAVCLSAHHFHTTLITH